MLLAGIYTQHRFPIKHFGNDDIFMRVCEQLPIIWVIVSIPFFTLKAWSATGGGVVVVIALLTAITPYIKYLTSEFGVTNQRVIIKTGFIGRDSSDIMLTKIEGVQVDQEILERVLDYGSIAVTGVGGTKEPFHKISDPLEFREQVEEQVVAYSKI